MRLVLDTVTLIYAVECPKRLSKRAATVLDNHANLLEVSAVSLTEIAIKSALGKLNMSGEMIRQAVFDLDLRILPYTADHAYQLFDLPMHHADPFDRQLIAQALCEEIAIITPDEKFRLYSGLKLIW